MAPDEDGRAGYLGRSQFDLYFGEGAVFISLDTNFSDGSIELLTILVNNYNFDSYEDFCKVTICYQGTSGVSPSLGRGADTGERHCSEAAYPPALFTATYWTSHKEKDNKDLPGSSGWDIAA